MAKRQKFRIRTYFGDARPKKPSVTEYFLNLMYRSVIPLLAYSAIVFWESPWWAEAFLWVVLGFFVFYQFSWEID